MRGESNASLSRENHGAKEAWSGITPVIREARQSALSRLLTSQRLTSLAEGTETMISVRAISAAIGALS
jgi:hypothetical protein